MAFLHLYYLITPQEGLFSTDQSSSLVALFFDIILCKLIFDRVRSFPKLLSRLSFFLQSQLRSGADVEIVVPEAEEKKEEAKLERKQSPAPLAISRDDVEVVMGKLGFFCDPEAEQLKQSMGADQLLELFDEKEPSLEEVKEAFDVFDVNRDGFIDETELQRVLCQLGLKEGGEKESCKKMIRAFDVNGDGRIDFCEFVKFMDHSLC
ncbi:unnamed protein product [Linum tenue]|uniref:EF-hand domain-containing protein n=1 Tax=Linum tenue TaxID=586396 RepID=A0AAV0GVF0_9ROSI|nr:unnamed protein product [Linum tenue]